MGRQGTAIKALRATGDFTRNTIAIASNVVSVPNGVSAFTVTGTSPIAAIITGAEAPGSAAAPRRDGDFGRVIRVKNNTSGNLVYTDAGSSAVPGQFNFGGSNSKTVANGEFATFRRDETGVWTLVGSDALVGIAS